MACYQLSACCRNDAADLHRMAGFDRVQGKSMEHNVILQPEDLCVNASDQLDADLCGQPTAGLYGTRASHL